MTIWCWQTRDMKKDQPTLLRGYLRCLPLLGLVAFCCASLLTLYVRSYIVEDDWSWVGVEPRRALAVVSSNGLLIAYRANTDPRLGWIMCPDGFFHFYNSPRKYAARTLFNDLTYLHTFPLSSGSTPITMEIADRYDILWQIGTLCRVRCWSLSEDMQYRAVVEAEYVMIPYWPLMSVMCVAFFWSGRLTFRRLRRTRRIRDGCCSFCGYDLRASRDRCPECGHGNGSEK